MSDPYKQWQCMSCGEIYDEAEGLPFEGVAAGTRFADLSDDGVCPSCGANKSDFVLLENN